MRQCDLYYAYFHRDPETDEIVYVGVGTLDRAWQVNNRSKEHKEWLVTLCNDGYLLDEIVQLGGSGMPRSMALKHELELINEHRPRFNKNYNYPTKLTKENVTKAKLLRGQGLSYSQIQKELGVSTMTVYRALNGETKAWQD